MKNTTQDCGAAVSGVSLSAVQPVVAGVAASHLASAVRLHVGDINGLNGVAGGVGRGVWRGQPSLGTGMSTGMWIGTSAAVTVPAAPAAPAANVRQLDRVAKLDRRNGKQLGNKNFRTTVYEGPRPWQVPV